MEKENRAIGEMLLQQMQELLYGTPPYAPMEDAPGIYLETENDGTLTIILREKTGGETRLRRRTAAEELVAFSDVDFTPVQKEIDRLWRTHPCFEDRPETPMSDYEDLAKQIEPLAEKMAAIDPISAFWVRLRIEDAKALKDNGSPIFASEKGAGLLRVLGDPIRARKRLRNLLEIGFADFERGTQWERFRAMEQAWPDLMNRYFPSRAVHAEDGDAPLCQRRRYQVTDMFELCLLELSLYFQQSRQRIVRCECCWNYFVPKTKKETLYCDRVIDGDRCKDIGPLLKRKANAERDAALHTYDRLRRRMAERTERYENAAPEERGGLIVMSGKQYDAWQRMAHQARNDYLHDNLTAQEFIKKIDSFDELGPHDAEKKLLPPPDRTDWRRRIRMNYDFDPELEFADVMQYTLEAGDWSELLIPKSEYVRQSRGGHESLREKYRDEE